ncbi:transposase [Paenibacillus larvae subsp. pulvifaciens]|uniref:Transposase n=3 Tax=Paenibacillus larvae TaxID=1464 RepID=A0A1V0UYL5_9BACL|nr:helix-turn-helix domain-containing protein [Paenibacillus larvae]ARF67340.1 transposase [Paenibacillus larvae subsp. pulvifaciens]ARF67507.1 transposase [Paenibacillus larvae subsp. pulvifaciens]ARF67649.1 transposase [Paenibacillus larvae subsp. pulvifaciens]ARF68297.1 transposase [Paenibacillus larvae subsp. pulvifaciens]ARF68673.1 transposase [Paenibacillus larvae subsp. pulvifaciens]
MSHKAKVSGSEKIAAVEKYLRGEDSLNHLASLLDVRHSSVRQWLQTYQSLGPNGLLQTSQNASYCAELKRIAVEDYLAGGGSHMDICKRYGIKSTCQLRDWILKYNGHEKLNTSRTGGAPIMTKGRTTTYDERVEIVRFCIEHQHNYAQTADKFQVSYQQVYSWTNKYLTSGVDALQDRRGKRKSEDEMSEVEKLRARNKLLQAENRRKQMEIDLLKKLDEIERRRF